MANIKNAGMGDAVAQLATAGEKKKKKKGKMIVSVYFLISC